MQWMYAVVGLLLILVGVFFTCIGLFDKIETGRLSRVGGVLIALIFVGVGVWLAWPIFVGVKDLVSGSHHAHEIIDARKAKNAESDRGEYVIFQKVAEIGAVAFSAVALFLCWSMRRRDPGSRRPWVVLAAGLCAGYVVLVHWGFHLLPSRFGGDLIEQPLRWWLSRNQALLTFGLYAEILWAAGLAGSTFTGLPIGPWTAFLVPVALLPGCVASYLNLSWWKHIVCWLLSIFLGVLLNEVRKAESEGEMATRADRALVLSSRLLETDELKRPRLALYLRPFVSTGTLDTQYVSEGADALDFETVLSYAVRPELSLIGLNRPQEQAIVGAGYIYGADQDWFERFQRLANTAAIIFLLPSAHHGTLDEVQWVVENHAFGKCIFLMPETVTGEGYQAYVSSPSPVRVYEERINYHAPDWEQMRTAVFERVKILLPEYQDTGAVFMLDEGGGVRQLEPLLLSRSMLKVIRLRRMIRRVLRPADAETHSPMAQAL
jgi:hypothetical protein